MNKLNKVEFEKLNQTIEALRKSISEVASVNAGLSTEIIWLQRDKDLLMDEVETLKESLDKAYEL